MAARLPQPSRADAHDNRKRILAAARAAFAAHGLSVPMREIARRADVGPATLYRHFATKQILATEAYANESRACQAIVADAVADPDPWHGFRLLVERTCELHAHNRDFTTAFQTSFPDAAAVAADRKRLLAAIDELARRAKAGGRLRADFTVGDLVLMLTAHRGIRATSPRARLAASRRFAALAIQAFQAPPQHG